PTEASVAFDLYSRAKSLMITTSFSAIGGQNLRKAVDLLEQALARDSSFFLAQCQLAYAHDNLYFLGLDHTPARLAAAQAAVEAAFRLQPDAGEAHLARAEHLYRGYLDYPGAVVELEIAQKSLPNDPRVYELTGYIARRRGQQEEGLRNLQRAIELDPRNLFTLQQIALSYFNLTRFRDDAVQLRRGFGGGVIARMMKNEAKARDAFGPERVVQEKLAAKQPDYGPAMCILGLIDAGLGQKEQAIQEGKRAMELLPVSKDS